MDSLLSLCSSNCRVLCLYSGGLDGSYLLYHLKRLGLKNPVALTVDLGGDSLQRAVDVCRALSIEHLVWNGVDDFIAGFVHPAIAAQARYLGGYPISASLSRPLIAQAGVRFAEDLGCNAIVHASNCSQNSLRRFNGAIASLGFGGHFGSPFAQSSVSRDVKIKELANAGIDFGIGRRAVSIDTNLWCREFEYGVLDNPEFSEAPEFLYEWTRPKDAGQESLVALEFEKGIPVSFNGGRVQARSLIEDLNHAVGSFGLGRYQGLEELETGFKVQEFREMPAAYLLLDAFRHLEAACVSGECIREKMQVEQLWVREAAEGRWFGTLRCAAESFISEIAKEVSGSVTYRLSRFRANLCSIKVDKPLYIRSREEYEGGRH